MPPRGSVAYVERWLDDLGVRELWDRVRVEGSVIVHETFSSTNDAPRCRAASTGSASRRRRPRGSRGASEGDVKATSAVGVLVREDPRRYKGGAEIVADC